MNITIVGGGNIGTLMAAEFACRGHKVSVLTSSPEKWDKKITAIMPSGEVYCVGEVYRVTDSVRLSVENSDYIFVTLPSIAQGGFAEQLLPYANDKMKIGIIPGYGGAEIIFKSVAERGAAIFGFQRVHAIARLSEYGRTVCMNGRKDSVFLASIDASLTDGLCKDMELLFNMPCVALPNYLCVTLTPSNPILHTSRLYGMFGKAGNDARYERNILFYEEWTDRDSELLISSDSELQKICRALDKMDLSSVRSLKDHYESYNVREMTEKISSIPAFRKITSPMIERSDGWIPDFASRYFSCDFAYGLDLLIQFGEILGVKTPTMNMMMNWYRDVSGDNERAIDLKKSGFSTPDDIYSYYHGTDNSD